MRKIMLAIFLFIFASIFMFVYLKHPILLKLVYGTGRIIYPPLQRSIYIDGQLSESAKCFKMDKMFNGNPTDNLILWIPDKTNYLERRIIMVDRQNHTVGIPNYSNGSYQLIANKFLVQAESADWFIAFSNGVKGWSFDPRLVIENDTIVFNLPKNIIEGKNVIVILHDSI